MRNYLKLMRIPHYIKNLLILAAPLCSGLFFSGDMACKTLFGFLAFCFVSSAVYVINDVNDAKRDRLNPAKAGRPVASGAIAPKNAIVFAAILFIIGLFFNTFASGLTGILVLVIYLLLNIAYSLGLKNVAILDVVILVSGYVIRIIYGSVISGVSISGWLYLTVISLSFFLALGKRRGEQRKSGDAARDVLHAYSASFLDKNMYVSLALADVFYALWSMNESTAELYGTKYVFLTVPLFIIITLRYSFDIEGDSDGDPVEVLLHDKVLMLLAVLYIIVMALLLYL
ncbi:MAG: decaprenyl-phosphate phosphoribosyltransferase [Lachnospiraceae bacterium]|nr:decaprenyl-phosphate phosphoribosyltransferase [Candidatus Minthocola equi]